MRSPTGREPPSQEESGWSIRYLEKATREFPDDYKYFWVAGTRYFLTFGRPMKPCGGVTVSAALSSSSRP